MKILWFTNSACSLSKEISPNSFSGGWMVSLENRLNNISDIELFISFYNYTTNQPTTKGKTQYYPVLRKKKRFTKIRERVLDQYYVDYTELKRLVEVVNTVNPDLIHIHGTEDNFGLIQKMVSQPVVISIQGIISSIHEKFFSGVPREIIKKHEPIRSKLLFKSQTKRHQEYKSTAINEREILSISKYIIGRTNWDRRITSILSAEGKYYHVEELLRDEFYNKAWTSNKQSTNNFKIITIAGGPIYKGLETIVKAARILQSHTEIDFSWNIVGLSENDEVVRMIVSWMGINFSNISIKLLGKLPPDKFIPIMLESDVYCQASHIENSPNSLCEAMYLGMPVVATYAGGTESILVNGVEGILIQDGDSYSMAGALYEIKMNTGIAVEMGNKARERAMVRHNPDKIVRETLNIYEEIIHK